jgi:predicted Zn-dependent protease with MMP-like domain
VRRDERERFDALFEEVLASMPDQIHAMIEEVPVVLEDRPSRALLEAMGMDPEDDDLCGVHNDRVDEHHEPAHVHAVLARGGD